MEMDLKKMEFDSCFQEIYLDKAERSHNETCRQQVCPSKAFKQAVLNV
jgi:hypothetical protein